MASFQYPFSDWQMPSQPSQPQQHYASTYQVPPPPTSAFQASFPGLQGSFPNPFFTPAQPAPQAPEMSSAHASMTLNIGMVQRIAVLETELRKEKEDKAVAQQTCAWLLQQVRQSSSQVSTPDNRSDDKLSRAQHKINKLKEKLRSHHRIRSYSRELAKVRNLHDEQDLSNRRRQYLETVAQVTTPTKISSPVFESRSSSGTAYGWNSDSTTLEYSNLSDQSAELGKSREIVGHGLGIGPPLRQAKDNAKSTFVFPQAGNENVQVSQPEAETLNRPINQREKNIQLHCHNSAQENILNLMDLPDVASESHIMTAVSNGVRGNAAPGVAVGETPPSLEKLNNLLQSSWAPVQRQEPARADYFLKTYGTEGNDEEKLTANSPKDILRTQAMLMYRPAPGDVDVYRTILVTNIPSTTSLSDVLVPVCGGAVASARFMNTMAICGSNSALIIFYREASARLFTEYAKRTFEFVTKPQSAVRAVENADVGMTYSLLDCPTFPVCGEERYLTQERGHTRLVAIYNLDQVITRLDLQRLLMRFEPCEDDHTIIRTFRGDDGRVTYIECSSIYAAAQVIQRIRNSRALRARFASTGFAKDPCDRPVPPTPSEIVESVQGEDPKLGKTVPAPEQIIATSADAVNETEPGVDSDNSSTESAAIAVEVCTIPANVSEHCSEQLVLTSRPLRDMTSVEQTENSATPVTQKLADVQVSVDLMHLGPHDQVPHTTDSTSGGSSGDEKEDLNIFSSGSSSETSLLD